MILYSARFLPRNRIGRFRFLDEVIVDPDDACVGTVWESFGKDQVSSVALRFETDGAEVFFVADRLLFDGQDPVLSNGFGKLRVALRIGPKDGNVGTA